MLLLAEPHISIHTWPEAGFAAVDIFMCGAARPQLALEQIERALRPASTQLRAVARGLVSAWRMNARFDQACRKELLRPGDMKACAKTMDLDMLNHS